MTKGIIALFVGLLSAGAWAQEEDGSGSERRRIEGVRIHLPDISIKPDIRRLDSTLKDFTSLTRNLDDVNRDLSADFERYLENPQNEVLASSLERKMAEHAEDVVKQFDKAIANQDVLIANFKGLTRKLNTFNHYLGRQARTFAQKVSELELSTLKSDKELIELAVRHREADDPEEKAKLKREFSLKFSEHRMHQRYLTGYQRNLESYHNLRKNIDMLVQLFDGLQGKFVQLIKNLETERQFLVDSIKFQANLAHMKLFMKENFESGENSVMSVAEKLVTLYNRVNTFTQVYDQINQNMGGFISFNQGLLDVASKLEEAGDIGLATTATQLDDKMLEYAEREDLLGEIEDKIDEKTNPEGK